MRHAYELVFLPATKAIMNHFSGLLGVRIAFFAPDGEEIYSGNNQSVCTYCRLVRAKLGREKQCHDLDAKVRQEVTHTATLKSYVCHAGMNEAIMPVNVRGRHIGFMMIGQFRHQDTPPDALLKNVPLNLKNKIKQAFALTPKLTPMQVRHALGMLELIVHHVTEKRLVDVRDAIEPVLDHLRRFPESRLSLQKAARLAGYSPIVFSRLFKKVIGQSYSSLRVQLLLEKADDIFSHQPHIQVQEVAYRLGFDDPFYFSRLYRKKRGVSPKESLKRMGDLKTRLKR